MIIVCQLIPRYSFVYKQNLLFNHSTANPTWDLNLCFTSFYFSLNLTRASGQSCLLLKSFANKLISLGLHIGWMKDIISLYNSVTFWVHLWSQHSTTGWPNPGSAGKSKNSSQNIVTGVRNTILDMYGNNKQRWEAAISAHTHKHKYTNTHSLSHLCRADTHLILGGWAAPAPRVLTPRYFSCGYVSLVLCVLIHIKIQLDYLSLAWLVTFQIPCY